MDQGPRTTSGPPPPEPATFALPPAIELAWGRQEARSRGPKRGLTLQLIVAAGVNVASSEGVGALSMARVAAELGVGTMSLYRYVSAKDQLLELMVDTALGRPPAVVGGQGWRAGLNRWAHGVRAAYLANPWVLRVPISGPPLGPNNVAWLETALACMSGTALAEQDKVSTVLLLSGFVRNHATLNADMAAAMAGNPVPHPTYGRLLSQLVDPAHFPAIQRVIDSGCLDDDDDPGLDADFSYGLERILDGVAAHVAKTQMAKRSQASTAPGRRTTS